MLNAKQNIKRKEKRMKKEKMKRKNDIYFENKGRFGAALGEEEAAKKPNYSIGYCV